MNFKGILDRSYRVNRAAGRLFLAVMIAAAYMLFVSVMPTYAQALEFPDSAKQTDKPERVTFKKGAVSATVSGLIHGYETKDYLLRARANQTMTVHLKSANIYTYFIVRLPDGSQISKSEETDWSNILPETGDYLIRVFMMRAGARKKDSVADYTLNISIK
ncbi:MAG: hypothetical protein HZB31_03175 [Nitrospirae bacterium]|nr:hypothetical protein [Nitrospirota bacterium]